MNTPTLHQTDHCELRFQSLFDPGRALAGEHAGNLSPQAVGGSRDHGDAIPDAGHRQSVMS